jgi:hypothetical protein
MHTGVTEVVAEFGTILYTGRLITHGHDVLYSGGEFRRLARAHPVP